MQKHWGAELSKLWVLSNPLSSVSQCSLSGGLHFAFAKVPSQPNQASVIIRRASSPNYSFNSTAGVGLVINNQLGPAAS
jgi:hypothetical protein